MFYENNQQLSQNSVSQQPPPQQQQQSEYSYQANNYQASRESSVSSNVFPQPSSTNDTSEQQQQQPQLYNQGPPTQGFMVPTNDVRKNSVASMESSRQHENNRSRLSSTSTNGGQMEQPQFTPFNPYQTTPKQQKLPSLASQPLFDPSAQTGLQRSSTYPSAEKPHERIGEEKNDNGRQNNNKNEDEDDLLANPKPKIANKGDEDKQPEDAQVTFKN